MSTPSHTPPPVPRSGTPGTPGTPVRSGSAADLRRKSIDQVLTGVLDPKQKDQLFSPKTLNKKQRALSKSHSLGLAHVVGNYRIGATIGKGRYSVVKLANHVLTNEFVAIKIVSKSRLSKEDVRVLEREMQIMKLLEHPNVVKLYEVIDTRDYFYLVMEYVDGRTLAEKLPDIFKLKKKKREEVVRRIFTQLVDALAYCHRMHVVHRDVKPDNILVQPDGNIKLADWGFSNRADSALNTHCGTPYYASPELFRPGPYSGPPSDLWACGVLLFFLCFGKLPFKEDPIRTFIANANYNMPRDAPPSLRSLIEGLLVVLPDRRMSAREVLSHPWVTVGLETPSSAPAILSSSGPSLPRAASADQLMAANHDDIVALMVALGFHHDEITESLNSNAYDQVAATYYLLRDSPKLDTYRLHLLNVSASASSSAAAPASPGSNSGSGGELTPRRSRASSASRMLNFLLSKRRFSTAASNSLPGSPAAQRTRQPD